MFKKPIKLGAQNQLSGKDRKTIKTKLCTLFNPDCVETLLTKNDKIVSCKTSGGSKMVIYQGSQYPIIVDGTGKSDFFPTVYTLQAYQTLAKCLDLNEGVQAYIFNGANLMWPGVRSYAQLKDFSKDQVIGIRNCKGEIVGVGALGCSKKELQSSADKSGVAVYMLHYKGDKLWQTGPKTPVEVIVKGERKIEQMKIEEVQQKKEEKKEQQIIQKTEKVEKKQKGDKKKAKQPSPEKDSESKEDSSSSEDLDFSSFIPTKKQQTRQQPQIKIEQKGIKQNFEQDDNKKGKKKGGKKQKGKGKKDDQFSDEETTQKKQEQAPKSAISTKLMDQYFRECFLNALKLCKVQKQLPIDSGRFYMDFMLLARPDGVKLQIKDTSYKKLGKFYEEMSKQKFIQFKHSKDKKGQQGATINKIFYQNQELKNYEPTINRIGEKDIQKKQQEEQMGQNNALVKKKKLTISKTFHVSIVYKPSQQLKAFLYPRTINYIPTQEEEQAMKKEQEEIDNLPTYFSEHEIKAIIEERINSINQNKSKTKDKDKDKVEKDKIIAINYHEDAAIAAILKKEIEEFEENASEGESEEEETQQKNKKKKKQKKGPKLLKIDRQALVNKLMKKCSTSHHILDKEQKLDVFKDGAFKGIQLVAEKANNKNITKIIGLETFIAPKEQADEQLNWLANALQQKFACSVNMQNLPGKNAGKEIIVHGNFINDLEQMFVVEYGIKKEFIASQNKLDKKKKNH